MTETVVRAGITPDAGSESIVDRIAKVETFCVELPYRGQVNFRAVSESKGQYVLLRLACRYWP